MTLTPDLPGQFDVRPEGVWFPWTGHVTLELPKKVIIKLVLNMMLYVKLFQK